MDQFGRGRTDRRFSAVEEEPEENYFPHHPPPFALAPPPSSSPSSSSSSSAAAAATRWPAPRPMGTADDVDPLRPASLSAASEPAAHRHPAAAFVEKEHMFDKVVTPSDVGKLNRLVIPKQHAEKYFPLDASGNEKGLLLNFEDRTGKQWRFRYSYWNSSQSYVMTKGWSRFVKEKRLDAGDTVSFGRGVGAGRDLLFIDWKRRPDPPRFSGRLPVLPGQAAYHHLYQYHRYHDHPSPMMSFAGPMPAPWNHRVAMPPPPPPAIPPVPIYGDHHRIAGYGGYHAPTTSNNPFSWCLRPAPPVQLGGGSSGRAGGDDACVVPVVLDSVPLASSNAAGKGVRLFGVNLQDCSAASEDGDSEGEIDRAPAGRHPLQLRLGVAPEIVVEPSREDRLQPAIPSFDFGICSKAAAREEDDEARR